MAWDACEQAIARSIVDTRFRARLLTDPLDTLADYGLGPHEIGALADLRPRTLVEFTSTLLRLRPSDYLNSAEGTTPVHPSR
jgi:hypothetical protein